jgi:signal transduction histidine kinase
VNDLAGWAVRHPRAALAAKIALVVLLLGLVSYEGLLQVRQPSFPRTTVWVAGILVCLCAVPYPRVPLVVRATAAVAVSWSASVLLIAGERPTATWGLGEAVALLVILADVVQHASGRAAAVLGPMLAVAAVIAPMRDVNPGAFTVLYGVLAVAVAAYALIGRVQAGQRVRDLEAVRSAERLELARELHDMVAHHVTGIVVQARAARYTGTAGPEAFERIEAAGAEALAAMRRLVHVLREPPGDGVATTPVAGMAETRELTEAFSRTGPPVVLNVPRDLEARIPPDVAAAVHRIVREALTNTRKHAGDATHVRVGLRETSAGLLELRVADDGTHAARLPAGAHGSGLGLVGLTERAEALGGTLEAGPAPEGGWLVQARLPMT